MAITDQLLLDYLEPIAKLSAGRKKELSALCFIEKVNKGTDSMRMNVAKAAQAIYLVKGDLELRYDDKNAILHGGTQASRHPTWTPTFAKLSINDGSKVKIAAIHPDF